jgi:hypothetical protein
MGIHRQAIDGAKGPGIRPLDGGASAQLTPHARQRFLDRVGRLLVGQAQAPGEAEQLLPSAVVN